MHLVLFDGPQRLSLQPFTLTRPVADLRLGIDRIWEKWARHWQGPVQLLAYGPLAYHSTHTPGPEALYVNGALLPEAELLRALQALGPGEGYTDEQGRVVAYRGTQPPQQPEHQPEGIRYTTLFQPKLCIEHPWHLFSMNGAQLRRDFDEITAGRQSAPIADKHTALYGQVFAEEGVDVKAAILDGEPGPIYLAAHSQVQPGAIVQGAHAICEHAVVNVGGKLRGDSTIGPYSKVGGEVANSLLWGYSNKGHDGYLGNSVLGAWCNLGADTNTSNLKNNYSLVQVYSMVLGRQVETGLQFCGLLMGDHSKTGINTMLNTGTVVGVSANIYGGDFPPKYVPSFAWGGSDGFEVYAIEKALETARRVMQRRGIQLTDGEEALLRGLAAGR